jgi:hypothetical protein
MLCCVVAACLIVRYIIRWRKVRKYFGFESGDEDRFGWSEYCELDRFTN